MKSLFSVLAFCLVSLTAWNQCNIVATGMANPATCAGDCDGSITYIYQNTGAPGSPYTVALQDSDGNMLSFTTHINEFETIPFTNLCADNYSITIQGMSCSNTIFVAVTEPTEIVVNANTGDPGLGLDNGWCSLIASGGTPPYIYSIDGGASFQSSNTFNDLPAGNYTGIVQDANGCQEEVDFTLTDNTICNVVVTATPAAMPLCYGGCTGVLQYAYFDGNNNNPYLIELTQGGTTIHMATNNSPSGSGTFSNLCAGVYYVEVTDNDGCTGSYPVTITQPSQLNISGVSTTDASSGMNNGAATISATGGTPAYSYSLDGVTYQASNIFTGLAAGVYIAYVKDSNGCISIFTFIIQTSPGCFFNLNATAINQSSCSWSCDGEIAYTFSGAVADPPFSIVLESNGTVIQTATNPNQTVSSSFSGLCPGDYTITVTNSSGCSEMVSITLIQPPGITLTASTIAATPGNSDGSITINASGGTAPYQFSIDNQLNWQSSSTFTGLAAGIYVIYVQDANGCLAILTVLLDAAAGCNFNLVTTATPTACAYACDGFIIYSFNDFGNNPPYTIELIQGGAVLQTNVVTVGNGGTGQFLNLCEGVYTVQMSDANGCTDSETIYIDTPDALVVTAVDVDDANAGMSDGSAEVEVTGGTAPYQFSIDNGTTWQSSNLFSGLAAGIYVVYVEDANGCLTLFTFVVNEDPGCTIATTLFANQPISCYGGCDGILGYAYSEGISNPPYTVTLLNNGTVVSTSTETVSAMSGTFTNLCVGNYTIEVTNGNGCLSYISNYTLTQPDEIIISVDVTNASTGNSNGVAQVNVNGGTGQYMYSLDGINYQTSNIFDSLTAGIYVVYVQDANGCTSFFTFLVEEDTNCNIVVTAFSSQVVSCAGMCDGAVGFAFNDVNINPPYTATLTNTSTGSVVGSQVFTTGNGGSGNFSNLCAGIYYITVQDANGCQSLFTVQVIQPDYLNISSTQINATPGNSDGSITVNVTGGTAPYQYSMDGGTTWQTSNVFNNLGAGFYIIHVEDANGCTQLICIILDDSSVASISESDSEIYVYPNPTTGIVFVRSDVIESVKIYATNGQLLCSLNETSEILVNLTEYQDGLYILEIETIDGKIQHTRIVKK